MIQQSTKPALSSPSVPTVGPMPETPEWYAARRTCIGASQAAAACGISPYSQPLDVYLTVRGELPEREDTTAMRLGRRIQDVTLQEYQDYVGWAVTWPQPLYRHAEYPFIAATPDARLEGDDKRPVEAKTLTGGYESTLTGGDESTLTGMWYDGTRHRIAVGYVGEDGIEPNVAYRVDTGKFVRVEATP